MGCLCGWFGGECVVELVGCRVRDDEKCEGESKKEGKGEMRLVWEEMKMDVGQVSE